MEFKSSDELREFILNRQEFDEEPLDISSTCNGMQWKKDRWIVRVDNKRVMEITKESLPSTVDIRAMSFVDPAMRALRNEGLAGLQEFIKSLS